MDSLVELTGTYLLTDAGVSYCVRRGIPLRDVRMHNGNNGTGFVWTQYHPAHVQRFVSNKLLRNIDIEQLEFLSRRRAIMDTTRIVVIGVLFQLFRPELKTLLTNSPLYKSVRPRARSTSREAIGQFSRRHLRTIRVLQEAIGKKPADQIKRNTAVAETDRREMLQDLQMFVKAIDVEIWFYIALCTDNALRTSLFQSIQDVLSRYVSRTRIADYLTFLLLELLEKAEYTQWVNFAERDPYVRTHPESLQEKLAEPAFREKLAERARKSNTYLNLNYEFQEEVHPHGSRPKIVMSIANKGLIGYKSRQDILAKKNRNVKRTPLSHFYQETNQIGDDLGMFYLSYVQEACRKAHMEFDADILRDEVREETIARLIVTI